MIELILGWYLLGIFLASIIVAAEWNKHSLDQNALNIVMSWAYVLLCVTEEIVKAIKGRNK